MHCETLSDAENRVLLVLEGHQGRANGIGAEQLAVRASTTPRNVRRVITLLREDFGLPICGRPETGYYLAATEEELEETLAWLHNRALTSLALEAKMRRITLPDLAGQLALELDGDNAA